MDSLKLLAGLGNPGKEYDNTRHNFGFMLIDALLAKASTANIKKLSSSRDKYELWKVQLPELGRAPVLFLKPLTYMNNSGIALQHVCSYYNIEPEQIIIAHDEMDIPLGEMRFKIGGGSAGHNGIKSIAQHLGTPEFYRLRLGIGKSRNDNSIGHVLGHFGKQDGQAVEQTLDGAIKGIEEFAYNGFIAAQQYINGFRML